jgi:hypothetical protein
MCVLGFMRKFVITCAEQQAAAGGYYGQKIRSREREEPEWLKRSEGRCVLDTDICTDRATRKEMGEPEMGFIVADLFLLFASVDGK